MTRIVLFLAAAALSAPAPCEGLNPVEFFHGRSHGDGLLKVIFQSPQRIAVDSVGSTDKDGSLVLKQVINQPGKPPRTRYWRMRQEGPNRFSGTLTDAAGPVAVDMIHGQVRIRYTGQNHLNFEQWLTAAGPKVVHNAMRVKRFGIVVAHFDEVIRKLD